MPHRPTVVLDFDGTLALGLGPVLAYARALGDQGAAEATVHAAIAAAEDWASTPGRHRDAYDAVRDVALAHGVTAQQLSAAYLASRHELGSASAPVHAPEGLTRFLAEIAPRTRCVLATNAPATGVDRALAALGLAGAPLERHHDLGKPAGLLALLEGFVAAGPVLAVGDIWENDLAPAEALGAATALVGERDVPTARPTFRGRTLADLYDPIRGWLAS